MPQRPGHWWQMLFVIELALLPVAVGAAARALDEGDDLNSLPSFPMPIQEAPVRPTKLLNCKKRLREKENLFDSFMAFPLRLFCNGRRDVVFVRFADRFGDWDVDALFGKGPSQLGRSDGFS
jgi:hypothetical protein